MSGNLGILISGLRTLAFFVPSMKACVCHVFLRPLSWRKEFLRKWRLGWWKFTTSSLRDLCHLLVNLRHVHAFCVEGYLCHEFGESWERIAALFLL